MISIAIGTFQNFKFRTSATRELLKQHGAEQQHDNRFKKNFTH